MMENDRPDDEYGGAPSAVISEGQSASTAHDNVEINRRLKSSSISLGEALRLLFSKRWWWTTLLVLAGMMLLARLGVWQLNRLSQRRQENEQLIQQLNAPPVELSGNIAPAEGQDLIDRLALVKGKFDYDNEIILTQQSYQRRPGVHLITPLIIEGTDTAVLVDRGWAPASEASGGDLSKFTDGSFVTVEGVVQASEAIPGNQPGDSLPKREWYRVDITAIENQIPYSLLPVYIKWLPKELDLDPPIRAEREIDLTEGSHLSYAIQWFTFTSILGIGYIAFIVRNERK
jgi:surfeit locus 1 family protein